VPDNLKEVIHDAVIVMQFAGLDAVVRVVGMEFGHQVPSSEHQELLGLIAILAGELETSIHDVEDFTKLPHRDPFVELGRLEQRVKMFFGQRQPVLAGHAPLIHRP
jgi:hypothetical protein